MKRYGLTLAIFIFLSLTYYCYLVTINRNEVTKTKLYAAGDSVVYSNTEYLKDVRRSNDGNMAFEVPLSEIMEREKKFGPLKSLQIPKQEREKEYSDRDNLPQNPDSKEISQYPERTPNSHNHKSTNNDSPQTLGINFNGVSLSGTNPSGYYPPDVMGEVGPAQYIIHVNGRIVSFSKSTGLVDGAINTTTNNFFAGIMTNSPGTYTTDPRIRYDRLTKKWYLLMIDVPQPLANRVLLAVSPDSIITSSTVFRFFFYQQSKAFLDYPTLGLDANALYIGGNLYDLSTDEFVNSNALVIKKSSIQGTGPMVITDLGGLIINNSGPFTPQGVDNPDPNATEGYFIGVDKGSFGTLMIRRVLNPGGTPSLSPNIPVTVPTTSKPLKVPHLGNTGGENGRLDALDDKLFMAQMRNGSIWTVHNIGVNSSGTTSNPTRNGSRWYQVSNLNSTPALIQSGTVFDNSTNAANYWLPTIATSGQGHSAMVYCIAGANTRINMGSVGRLSSDALGTMQTPFTITNNTSFAYNPPADPGTAGSRRWGDYSCIRVDPNDDMTFWAIHQWCNGENNYGVYVAELKAPPPATPYEISPPNVSIGSNISVNLIGKSINGSGFFDPGSGFTNHLKVAIDGVIVNSVSYINDTTINLNVNTEGAVRNSTRLVTVTNPDGQISSASIFKIVPSGTPDKFVLWQNYPNPFNPTTKIDFDLPENANVSIKIYDISGKQVAEVLNENKQAGYYSYPFIANGLSSGLYFYSIKAVTENGTIYISVKKMMLIK
ncbi:MAG: T9SS type A sorting domain-containing protein [Bacteroidetes bacterium]|nr:T9SS type A sorting domain-containing protein [Bacteroidota bacterium]